MSQHAEFIEYVSAAAAALAEGDAPGATQSALDGLRLDPNNRPLLKVLVRAAAATEAASVIQGLRNAPAGPPRAFDLLSVQVDVALEDGTPQAARTAIALAEAEASITPAQSAQLKAQMALAQGDWIAARGILVMAIERAPDVPALRRQLMETLVASGGAADARAVLDHIAKAPVNPPAPHMLQVEQPPAIA